MVLFINIDFMPSRDVCLTLVLGFMLLAAYCIGFLLEKIGLPRITGYIFTGLFLGPYFLNLYSSNTVTKLGFLNNLALAFIAFCAGGELRMTNIRRIFKSIVYMISGVTIVVFVGITLIVFSLSNFIPFMSSMSFPVKLAIASIFGVIAAARSPSSAIAIINETKAQGPYTDLVLSVSIAMDVVIIIAFAAVISLCRVFIKAGGSINPKFFLFLLFEIAIAFILGFLLGKFIVFLLDKLKVEFSIVIIAVGFLVIKFSHYLSDYLNEIQDISLKLEPLLICMAAGFSIQNFSDHGERFLWRMNRISLPIYIAFFVITGASININILKNAWFLGIIIVIARAIFLYIGSFLSGKLTIKEPKIYKNVWMGFITQAGVSLGLLAEVVRQFPEIGKPIQTILIASITLNQLIGPVAFKWGLKKVGETRT